MAGGIAAFGIDMTPAAGREGVVEQARVLKSSHLDAEPRIRRDVCTILPVAVIRRRIWDWNEDASRMYAANAEA